ncbi:aromatic acid exporter family protein [Clostridium botulinum]|nr:aromatic acid exporter family protein [Clostridium botulinum]
MKSVGMRNIKTALAVTLSILISAFFKLDSPFYAAIAAVISMQNSVTGSYRAGKNRMLGTVTGALVGLTFSSISPNNPFLCGLGIIIVIYICNLLKWDKSITIACIVFIGIMVNLTNKTPLYYSIHRTLDTFIGITVSVLVNMFVKPPVYEKQIITGCKNVVKHFSKIPTEKIYFHNKVDIKKLKNQINNLENNFNAYKKEILNTKNLDENYIGILIKIFNETYTHLSFIDTINSQCVLNDHNYERFKNLYKLPDEYHKYNENDLNLVYNYHVSKIIYNLESLKKEYKESKLHLNK